MSQSVLLFFMQVAVSTDCYFNFNPYGIFGSTGMLDGEVFYTVTRQYFFWPKRHLKLLTDLSPISSPWSKTNYREPKGS